MPYVSLAHVSTPPDDTVLWRYLSFVKFVDLLENQTLWFARSDTFEDPLEGTHTDTEIQELSSLPLVSSVPWLMTAKQHYRLQEALRKVTYVNCWRRGDAESMAMWDIYGKGAGAVAIKLTVGSLKQVIQGIPHDAFIADVKYVDWSTAPYEDNPVLRCVRKDISYQHEAEVRAFFWDSSLIEVIASKIVRKSYKSDDESSCPSGKAIRCDLANLIKEIVIGPKEKTTVCDLVKRVIERYGLSVPLTVSNRLTIRPVPYKKRK